MYVQTQHELEFFALLVVSWIAPHFSVVSFCFSFLCVCVCWSGVPQILYVLIRVIYCWDSFSWLHWIGLAFFTLVTYVTYFVFIKSSLKNGVDYEYVIFRCPLLLWWWCWWWLFCHGDYSCCVCDFGALPLLCGIRYWMDVLVVNLFVQLTTIYSEV
jgi:hypothetical protein